MTPESPAILERLLRDNDLGWMIDMYAPVSAPSLSCSNNSPS